MPKIELHIGKPCRLFLRLNIPKGVLLNIKGYDKKYPSVVLFDRKVDIDGSWDFNCIIPQKAPVVVEINRLNSTAEQVELVKKWEKAIAPSPLYPFTKDQLDFIKWVYPICYYFNYLPKGIYRSDCRKFTLTVSEKVVCDETGREIPTPARVNRERGDFYVSKEWLSECTVPMRLFVMFHEFFHWYLQSTNEILVDKSAAEMYVALNLPRIEMLYALTKLFSGETLKKYKDETNSEYSKYNGMSEQEVRVKLMYEFIESQ